MPPDIPTLDQAGVPQVSREFLDLAQMKPLRTRVSPIDRSMSREQAAEFEAGRQAAPGLPSMPVEGSEAPVPELPPAAPSQAPGVTTPLPPSIPAVPVPGAPPIQPQDTSPIRKRIGKLYGQLRTAQEETVALAERAQRAEARLAELFAGGPHPFTNQYGSYPSVPSPSPANAVYPPESSPSPDGQQFVSRAEFQAALAAQARVLAEQNQLLNAHGISRREAELDFPDVFADPELKESADTIWAHDALLQRDPHGPYKAAALARGLRDRGSAAGGTAPTAERKAQLAGVGSINAEGPGQPVNDRATRYVQALAYATRTGRLEDFARARRIQVGAE